MVLYAGGWLHGYRYYAPVRSLGRIGIWTLLVSGYCIAHRGGGRRFWGISWNDRGEFASGERDDASRHVGIRSGHVVRLPIAEFDTPIFFRLADR